MTADQAREELPWVSYHPHLNREPGPKNTLYVATERLSLPGIANRGCPGAGLFDQHSESLRLSAAASRRPGQWLLPSWFHPDDRSSHLTYPGNLSRWSRTADGVVLEAVSRGQEFVLDCGDCPEAYDWIAGIIDPKEDRKMSP